MAGGLIDLGSIESIGRLFDVGRLAALIDNDITLSPGDRTEEPASLTRRQAQGVLDEVVRLVADLPRNSTPEVVWTLGANELLCHTDRTTLAFETGVVTMTVVVACDEVDGEVSIPVPFGVGTDDRPAGLLMSTFGRLQGPSEITEVWTDAITAFAWECLLEVCRTIAGNVGEDSRGRALIPGLVSAAPNRIFIHPMARHRATP